MIERFLFFILIYFEWRDTENQQYSVICHYSKNMRLALTDFNKNGYFKGIVCGYSWAKLQKKTIHRGELEKISICLETLTSQKSDKSAWDTRGYYIDASQVLKWFSVLLKVLIFVSEIFAQNWYQRLAGNDSARY